MDPAVGNAALWQYLNSSERREPIIGLSMMTEYRWMDNHVRNCFCCHCCMDYILSANYMCHLISANHRYNYIKMVYPHLVHDWPNRVHPNGRPRELRVLAQQVESEEGWGTLRVTEMKSSTIQSKKATAKSPLKEDDSMLFYKTTDNFLKTKVAELSKSTGAMSRLSLTNSSVTPTMFKSTATIPNPTMPTKPSATPAQEALWEILEAPFVTGAASKDTRASGKQDAISSATSAISKSTGAMPHLTQTTSSATPTISVTTANSKPTVHIPILTPPMFKYTATVSTTSTTTSKPSTTVCHSATVMPKPTATFSYTIPGISIPSSSTTTSTFPETLWEAIWENFEATLDAKSPSDKAVATGQKGTGACDAVGSPKNKVTSNTTNTPWKVSTKAKPHTTLTTCQTTKAGSKTGRIQTAGHDATQKRYTPYILPSLATAVSPASESSPVQTSESTKRFDSKTNGPTVGLNFLVRVVYDKRLAIYCQLCKIKLDRKDHRFGFRHRSNYLRFKRPDLPWDLSETELQTIVVDLAKKETGTRTQTVTMNSEREYEELTKAEVPEALAKIEVILRQQRGSSATKHQPESLKHQDMSTGLHELSHHLDGNGTNQSPLATGSQSSPMHTSPTDTQPETSQSSNVRDPRTQSVASRDPRIQSVASRDPRIQSVASRDPRIARNARTYPVAPLDTMIQPVETPDHRTQPGAPLLPRTHPVTSPDTLRTQAGSPQESRTHPVGPPEARMLSRFGAPLLPRTHPVAPPDTTTQRVATPDCRTHQGAPLHANTHQGAPLHDNTQSGAPPDTMTQPVATLDPKTQAVALLHSNTQPAQPRASLHAKTQAASPQDVKTQAVGPLDRSTLPGALLLPSTQPVNPQETRTQPEDPLDSNTPAPPGALRLRRVCQKTNRFNPSLIKKGTFPDCDGDATLTRPVAQGCKPRPMTPLDARTQPTATLDSGPQLQAPLDHKTQPGAPVNARTHPVAPPDAMRHQWTLHPNTQPAPPGAALHTKTQPGAPLHTKTLPGAPLHTKTLPGAPLHTKTLPGAPLHTKTLPGAPLHTKTLPGAPLHTKTQHGDPLDPKTQPGAPLHPNTHQGAPLHPNTHQGAPLHPNTHQGAPLHPNTHQGTPLHPNTHQGSPLHPNTHQGSPLHPNTHQGAPLHPNTHQGAPLHPNTHQGAPLHPNTHQGAPLHPNTHQGTPLHANTQQRAPPEQRVTQRVATLEPKTQAGALPLPRTQPVASPDATQQVATPDLRAEPVTPEETGTQTVDPLDSRPQSEAPLDFKTQPVTSGNGRTHPVAPPNATTQRGAPSDHRTNQGTLHRNTQPAQYRAPLYPKTQPVAPPDTTSQRVATLDPKTQPAQQGTPLDPKTPPGTPLDPNTQPGAPLLPRTQAAASGNARTHSVVTPDTTTQRGAPPGRRTPQGTLYPDTQPAQPGAPMYPKTQPGALLLPKTQPVAALDNMTQATATLDSRTQPGAPLLPRTHPVAPPNASTQRVTTLDPKTPPGTPLDPKTPPGTPLDPKTPPGTPLHPKTPPGSLLDPKTQPDLSTQPVNPQDTRTQPAAPLNTKSKAVAPPHCRTQPGAPPDSRTEPVGPPEARSEVPQHPITQQGCPQDPSTRQRAPQDAATKQQAHHDPANGTRQRAPQDCGTQSLAPQCSGMTQKAHQHPGIQPQDPEQRKERRMQLEETQKPLERPDRRMFSDPDIGYRQPVVRKSNTAGKSRVSYYLTVKLSDAERKQIVGLSSVLECQCGDISERLFPFYMCRSCEETVQLKHICGHITSVDHQLNYMSKNPDLMAVCNLEVWSEKMEDIKAAVDRVAQREQNPLYGMDAEVILLDKNTYHHVQSAPFSEGIHILEDIWRQQNVTSSCPPADQQPPEVTANKESVPFKRSLIETTPINVAIVKTEPIPEQMSNSSHPERLTTLNTQNSNTKVTIKQEVKVKQEDHTHPCFSGHTDMRKAVKCGLDNASSNGDGEILKRRRIEMRKAVKRGLDYVSLNGDGEMVKRRRSSKSSDGGGAQAGHSGSCSNVSASQFPSTLNKLPRVKAQASQSPSLLKHVVRVKVEPSQCPTSQNQEAKGKVEAASAPTTMASQVPHCEPSQMQPRPKLQLVLNSLKKLASSKVTIESPHTKPAPAASGGYKDLPSSAPITSIVNMTKLRGIFPKQSGNDVSSSQASPENAIDIDAMTSTSTQTTISRVKPKRQLDSKCKFLITIPNQSVDTEWKRMAPKPADDNMSNDKRQLTSESRAADVIDDDQSLESHYRAANPAGEPSATSATVINPNAAQASIYNTMAPPFNSGPYMGSFVTMVNPDPTSQQFTGTDYSINQPPVSMVNPSDSLPAAGYGTPVYPYGQVTQNPYFPHGYPYGTGTPSYYVTLGYAYGPGAQNSYYTHAYPYGTGPTIGYPGVLMQTPPQQGGGQGVMFGGSYTTHPTTETCPDMQRQQQPQ